MRESTIDGLPASALMAGGSRRGVALVHVLLTFVPHDDHFCRKIEKVLPESTVRGYRSEPHAGVDDRRAALLGLDDGRFEEGDGAEVALVGAQR